ncbi:transcriptional regulator, GntR family [Desulfosarcina variabilis str. Montpellier]|uniref:FadR/GntR family transcriptional regulator n=1 Tax=Desulfosarcina variabilis TaxID=2300 RepID=UPI003AFA8A62
MNVNKNTLSSKLERPKRLSDQVSDILREKIDTAVFKPGEKLPTETKLAETFGVSRTVIREALARLKSDGLLESRQGCGATVSESHQRSAFRFGHHTTGEPKDLIHLLELRAILESGSAALAALRRSQDQLEQMAACLSRMREAVMQDTDGADDDFQFHRLIAEAAGNPNLLDFMAFLNTKLVDQIQHARRYSRQKKGLPLIAEKEHEAIYQAIVAGDADAARAAAIDHITQATRRLGLEILNRK